MNRTDRLYALVEELRSRAPRMMRAADLATRFEVTTRTIERDLLALQEAGVPIWAQPGPGGGYSLNVDATLPPLNLTPPRPLLSPPRSPPLGRCPLPRLAALPSRRSPA
jgi:predicted DNA-binding transcriptional regulator YafY